MSAKDSKRRNVFTGKVLNVGVETVELPDGSVWDLEIIRHPGAAAVLPVTEEGNVLLVRQYRHAAGGWILEVPAGKLDPDEPPEVCARRETEEEIGYVVGRLEPLGWIFTTPGFADERIWLYRADQLTPGTQALEQDELLTVVEMPFDEAVRMAISGEITDAKTALCLLRVDALRRA